MCPTLVAAILKDPGQGQEPTVEQGGLLITPLGAHTDTEPSQGVDQNCGIAQGFGQGQGFFEH
jgi:hypothetical protein